MDGNRRLCWLSTAVFLDLNGVDPTQASNEDVYVLVIEVAGLVEPLGLRSLDAVHLASAILLADELEWFVAYDSRLLAAAGEAGLAVAAPS